MYTIITEEEKENEYCLVLIKDGEKISRKSHVQKKATDMWIERFSDEIFMTYSRINNCQTGQTDTIIDYWQFNFVTCQIEHLYTYNDIFWSVIHQKRNLANFPYQLCLNNYEDDLLNIVDIHTKSHLFSFSTFLKTYPCIKFLSEKIFLISNSDGLNSKYEIWSFDENKLSLIKSGDKEFTDLDCFEYIHPEFYKNYLKLMNNFDKQETFNKIFYREKIIILINKTNIFIYRIVDHEIILQKTKSRDTIPSLQIDSLEIKLIHQVFYVNCCFANFYFTLDLETFDFKIINSQLFYSMYQHFTPCLSRKFLEEKYKPLLLTCNLYPDLVNLILDYITTF